VSAFPNNPSNGQTANVNGVTYTYSSTLTAWTVTSSGGSLTTAQSISASGNITGGNILTAGIVSATANITGGNVLTSGLVSATGNITSAANITGGNLLTGGLISATGNITSAANIAGGNVLATTAMSAASYVGSVVSVTGSVTGGNLVTGGQISSSGNAIANNISTTNALFTKTVQETVTVTASPFTSPSNYDLLTQGVWYSTGNATANITVNIRGNSSVTAATMLAVGQSVTFALLITNGATAYYPNLFQVDSSNVTPKYQGGTAFTGGNANSTDVYSLTLIKTAATPTYTLLASQTKFA
jgi:hypothetical protein